MFRPLFCTVEIILGNGTEHLTPMSSDVAQPGDLSRVGDRFLYDIGLGFFEGPRMEPMTQGRSS